MVAIITTCLKWGMSVDLLKNLDYHLVPFHIPHAVGPSVIMIFGEICAFYQCHIPVIDLDNGPLIRRLYTSVLYRYSLAPKYELVHCLKNVSSLIGRSFCCLDYMAVNFRRRNFMNFKAIHEVKNFLAGSFSDKILRNFSTLHSRLKLAKFISLKSFTLCSTWNNLNNYKEVCTSNFMGWILLCLGKEIFRLCFNVFSSNKKSRGLVLNPRHSVVYAECWATRAVQQVHIQNDTRSDKRQKIQWQELVF